MRPGAAERAHTAATAVTLSAMTRDRLHKQIVRAVRHTYGAEAGLRTLVRLATSQMLSAGASREAVRRALTQCVVNHPTCDSGKPSLMTGETRSATLIRLMIGWADEACASHGEPSRS